MIFGLVGMSVLILVVILYVLRLQEFPRSVLVLGSIFNATFLSIWRVFKRMFVEYIVSKGYNNFNAIIIGAGRVGKSLAKEIKKMPGLGIKVVGFLDDHQISNGSDVKVLGKISDFKDIARKEFVNKIFITVHHDSDMFLSLLEDAKEVGVAVRVVPQGFELISGEFSKYNIGIIPILEYSNKISFRKQFGKRVFDFVASCCALTALMPLFIIIGFMIKRDSHGPIFYLSKRYGRNGKMFDMIKFRSMIIDADDHIGTLSHKNEADGPIFKIKNDPRTTNFGKILRKYSLDELPQIINVIRGDMSLVGPRPFPIEQIEKEDLKQLKRLEVRPGITGLWQIRGRSDISFRRLIKWDMWYINNWSFWLDLNIIVKTIPVVFKGQGAY
jgi:exopolysaccharide biosynthesis polyprenyl glycosylphosphotransferase